ncbi:MAG: HDIG domain-containing protein [Pirellulaceae bacterium]
MANLQSNRSRWTVAPPKSVWHGVKVFLQQEHLWNRVAVSFAGAMILYFCSQAWVPAFPYRYRQIPTREMAAKVRFEFFDVEATREAEERARAKVLCLYEHDPLPLQELRQALVDNLFSAVQKPNEETVNTIWGDYFETATTDGSGDGSEGNLLETPTVESVEHLKQSLSGDEQLDGIKDAVSKAFLEIERTGLLETLEHELGRGNMREIKIYVKGNIEDTRTAEVTSVRIPEVAPKLLEHLIRELKNESDRVQNPDWIAKRLFAWLKPRLPVTLRWDEAATNKAAIDAVKEVGQKNRVYEVGNPLQKVVLYSDQKSVVGGGTPLGESDIELLRAEHRELVNATPWTTRTLRSIFFVGLALTCFGLASSYLWQRHRKLLLDFQQFTFLIGAFCTTYCAMWFASHLVEARVEIIPLVLFAMAVSIAYQVGLAIMFSSLVIVLFTVAHSYGIEEFVILSVAATVAALFCKHIRSRTKSVYIGLITAAAVFPVTLAIQFMINQSLRPESWIDATWFAGGAGVAGLIMTALLPFLEKWFDIQTDISLLELSDPNHPLLRNLVQRAPGTYNHSINVASIAEAAADAIGANGLLCRVGAYFHDIGKMRKPEYFVENQSGGENKHDDLVPSMSTIVIIAHVKDGAEMAKKHHLPKSIIDLIEQHHGTTLVAYFYHRANQQAGEEEPVEEASFRYPGPKPQSPEAAVLMLADAVEGACRTLREPAPARIESLVDDITKKKLDDGQFDECAVTLNQIKMIQMSLVKSLNAMYHARVKYPDQQKD